MESQAYIELVYRNLKGELSPSEFAELNKLTAMNADLAELRIDIEDAWDLSGQDELKVTPKETTQLLAKLTKNKTSVAPSAERKSTLTIGSVRKWAMGIAAILMMVLGVTWMMRDEALILDKAGAFTLNDGTVVNLREGSTLEVFAFNEQERRVTLSGEAFFNVASDASKPFVVTSDHVRIKVLGTEFLVKEMPTQTIIELVEGKIETTDVRSKESRILTKGMKVSHSADGKISTLDKYENLSSWRKGAYQYKDVVLADVIEELSIIHNVQIEVTNAKLTQCKLNAVLLGRDVDQIIDRISKTFKTTMTKDGSKYQLDGGQCN